MKKRARSKRTLPPGPVDVDSVLKWLGRRGRKKNRDGMARYGIVPAKVYGVSMTDLRAYAKRLGTSHGFAARLWATGWHEARLLAVLVEEPDRVTPAQMDRWCRGFDNWALCDTACFHLFHRTPHAWKKIRQWATAKDEFTKRAAFALLASMSVHDKKAEDAPFQRGLVLIARAAKDERNFVKKAVNWALRSIGKRNLALHQEALALAEDLATSSNLATRWVGKDAARELTSAAVLARVRNRSDR